MKIKQGFTLRTICKENIICATGLENINFNKMITLNRTAAEVFQFVKDKEFNAALIAAFLKGQYKEVDMDLLMSDSEKLVASWKDAGIIDD
ncbi:MAG: PqqD family protein [Bacteroidales bacterium]|nr:PqqD family protein [Bacteroidales bacterium]